MWNLLGRLGALVLAPGRDAAAVGALVLATCKSACLERGRGLALVRRAIGAQVYFTAIQPLPLILLIALGTGWMWWAAAEALLERVPNPVLAELAPHAGVRLLALELGPLVVALVLVARSATAVSTELGYMRVDREVEALEAQGVNVEWVVVAPRLLGIAFSAALLAWVFAAVAVALGLVLARVGGGNEALAPAIVAAAFEPWIWGWAFGKAALLGLVLAAIACHHGLSVRHGFPEIPRANVRTAVQALAACFLLFLVLSGVEPWA